MGIKGLHKALSFCTVKDNLDNYRGQSLAIDTSSWLHKSVYSFSEKFVETTDRGQIDPDCVRRSSNYLHKRCQEILVQYNVAKIFLVMDGKRCPLKADESQDRDQKRRQNLEEARKYKAQGNRRMAEEKYKGCIRIKNYFTEAVMKLFRKHLYGESRVIIVSAPYEADAQLIKLCIDEQADAIVTEDSDVLVYCAAAHVAFPVLFKLDRPTGNCQKISMDFLLSTSPNDTDKAIKTNNKLESIIRNLASRQGRRKGFGVRLFVQACVLGGCDYSSNDLEGVGLVGAFKLVRDNAFRNDNVRFRKILQSLPKKVKQNLDIDAYEERLAKSEAVFFYHHVSHIGGDVKPLLVPRISAEENPQEHDHTNHYPFMKRFEDDWSFLGDEVSSFVGGLSKECEAKPAADLIDNYAPRDAIATKSNWLERQFTTKRPPAGPIYNPYKKAKSSANSKRAPNEESPVNNATFSKPSAVEQQPHKSSQDELDMIKYMEEIPDPRHVKRKFPSKISVPATSAFTQSDDTSRQSNQNRTEGRPEAHRKTINFFANFQYINSPVGDGATSNPRHQPSRSDDADDAVGRERPSHQWPVPTSDATANQPLVTTGTMSEIDLTVSDDEEVVEHSSRYFKQKKDPRRVTLGDSDEIPTLRRQSDSPLIQSSSCSASKHEKDWNSDDAVDSPAKQPTKSRPTSTIRNNNSHALTALKVRRQPATNPKASGPLLAGFQRQQQFFGSMKQSRQRIFAYSSSTKTKSARMKSLTAYFPSPEKAEVKNRPHFSQLALNTKQTDDDFLWDG